MMKRWARPLHEEARSNPTELPRSNAKFSPLVFITLRIPLPCRPLRIDFYSHDFHTLTNPLSRNSFVCTSIQNHGGVTGGYYPNWFCTCRAARAPSHLFSNLQPLAVSCLSFGSSRPLFSIVCSLFFQNTRGVGGALVTCSHWLAAIGSPHRFRCDSWH